MTFIMQIHVGKAHFRRLPSQDNHFLNVRSSMIFQRWRGATKTRKNVILRYSYYMSLVSNTFFYSSKNKREPWSLSPDSSMLSSNVSPWYLHSFRKNNVITGQSWLVPMKKTCRLAGNFYVYSSRQKRKKQRIKLPIQLVIVSCSILQEQMA